MFDKYTVHKPVECISCTSNEYDVIATFTQESHDYFTPNETVVRTTFVVINDPTVLEFEDDESAQIDYINKSLRTVENCLGKQFCISETISSKPIITEEEYDQLSNQASTKEELAKWLSEIGIGQMRWSHELRCPMYVETRLTLGLSDKNLG